MNILLTGKNGQVGWELQRTLASLGNIIATDKKQLDLAVPGAIRKIVRKYQPDLIVNAAAYTAVDKAESEPEQAMAINGTAPGVLAEEAKKINAGIIHYSTDYVFDGQSSQPYAEEDKPNPINVYGKTKLAGEKAIQEVGGAHIILRTSWVFGNRGKNFLLTMQRLAKEREEISIVSDQIGCPTWARTIAEVTAQMLVNILSSGNKPTEAMLQKGGVYHIAGAGATTWYDFAKSIIELSNIKPRPTLTPIQTEDYPLPASRPRYACLSSDKVKEKFNIHMPDWQDMLKLCLPK